MKKFNITVNGTSYEVEVEEVKAAGAPAPAAKPAAAPAPAPAAAPAAKPAAAPTPVAAGAGDTTVVAPMPGKIISVNVSAGQAVQAGDVLLILEAMKMQNEIQASAAGTVKGINVAAGQSVAAGDALVVLG